MKHSKTIMRVMIPACVWLLSGGQPAQGADGTIVTAIMRGGLVQAQGIAVDVEGNVYVAGTASSNAFKITQAGVTTEIIDAVGDGADNTLRRPSGIAVGVR